MSNPLHVNIKDRFLWKVVYFLKIGEESSIALLYFFFQVFLLSVLIETDWILVLATAFNLLQYIVL